MTCSLLDLARGIVLAHSKGAIPLSTTNQFDLIMLSFDLDLVNEAVQLGVNKRVINNYRVNPEFQEAMELDEAIQEHKYSLAYAYNVARYVANRTKVLTK